MKHSLALNLIKREIDTITSQMMPLEKQIADLTYQHEDLKAAQQELIESIKELGAKDAKPDDTQYA